jgi:hypothetical protein
VRYEGPGENNVVVGGVQRRVVDKILKGRRGLGKVGREKRRFAVIVQRGWGAFTFGMSIFGRCCGVF